MGKGDKKSKRGKITQGSYGKTRPRKSASIKTVPVKVLDESEKKASKAKVRKEVGEQTELTQNAEVSQPKTTKAASSEEKPKTTRKKKTEE